MAGLFSPIVSTVLKARLPSSQVKSVVIRPDRDHDGEEILRVRVLVEEGSRLEPQELKSLIRHTRDALAEVGEERFPMFTFLYPSDVVEAGNGPS
ncbi:MAG: hypothetical protein ACT4OK_14800 [Gemmobacter sp.]